MKRAAEVHIASREVFPDAKIGEFVAAEAGAPGTGRIIWRVTRIEGTELFGVVVSNTIRELDPSEVI